MRPFMVVMMALLASQLPAGASCELAYRSGSVCMDPHMHLMLQGLIQYARTTQNHTQRVHGISTA